jgi:hypothetical protein
MVHSGINIRVQKSLQLAAWLPLFCWLLFHNSIWESRSVHSVNMFYPFMFVSVDFFWNWLCFEFFHDIFILWSQYIFCSFRHKFHLCCCDSGFVLFF